MRIGNDLEKNEIIVGAWVSTLSNYIGRFKHMQTERDAWPSNISDILMPWQRCFGIVFAANCPRQRRRRPLVYCAKTPKQTQEVTKRDARKRRTNLIPHVFHTPSATKWKAEYEKYLV